MGQAEIRFRQFGNNKKIIIGINNNYQRKITWVVVNI